MRAILFAFIICVFSSLSAAAQHFHHFADSIRIAAQIPALGYAVISADSILEMQMLGNKKINTLSPATLHDNFRIGSNTKAITCTIAAMLVKQGRLNWDTPFFSLFPAYKQQSNPAYYSLTLRELLTFRNKLIKYTYSNDLPRTTDITGDEASQRRQFAIWLLQQPPVPDTSEINFSNSGYVLAGLMLEKATHKSYPQLVKELGKQLHISFGFGSPNTMSTTQPWGHDGNLQPEAPGNNPKLNWLLPAGNIHVSLHDYARFIQLQLQGLRGKSALLPAQTFELLHYGLPVFSYGWFWQINEGGHHVSHNTGNPGTFVTKVAVIKEADRAYIVFTNVQQEQTYEAVEILLHALEEKYGQ